MELPSLDLLTHAAEIVSRDMGPTPQYSWPLLNHRAGTEVWVKHENHSPIGAFKIRGALVYMDALSQAHPDIKTVIAATRGNYGQAVALAAKQQGLKAVIVVPFGNSSEKNHAMRALGVELIEQGHDYQTASEFAERLAAEKGYHRVPSFHELLVRGTGTYALEFLRAAPELEAVYVPIGLGSSICGMLAARAALNMKTRIIGVVAAAAPAYAISFRERKPVTHAASTQLADGLACSVPDPEAFDLILKGVERIIEVSEDEIAEAMRAFFQTTHNIAEGAGAAALAGLLKENHRIRGKRVGVVLTGSNVDSDVFARVLRI